MKKFIVAIGSNCNAEANIERAKLYLTEKLGNVRFTRVLKTRAIGIDSNDFLNCLAWGETDMSADELAALCKLTEKECGDTKTLRKSNKIVIDADVLLAGKTLYHQSDWERMYIKKLAAECFCD